VTRHRHTLPELPFPAGSSENGERPLVAIVGRPNVGKSTLFNRLVGRRLAIVHDEAGVTRDRHYAEAWFAGRSYTLVDTGGFDPESDDPMQQGIARQVELAVGEADVIVCVLDAAQGVTEADRLAVNLLRRTSKPVLYVANKADSPRQDAESAELYRLGLPQLFGISSLHGRGMGEFEAALVQAFPPMQSSETPTESEETRPVRIALVGRPNAGKSSLVNRLAGEERVLVDARPGTTRDAIDTLIEFGGKRYVLVDTAGIRRKAKVTKENSMVEAVSVLHAIRAIERADIVVLVCDAAEGVSEQDAKVLGLAVERGRGVIIGLNKADLIDDKKAADAAESKARDKLTFVSYASVQRFSAKTGRGVRSLMECVDTVYASFCKRVETSKVNQFFERVLATHPPPTMGGKAPRLYYITQAAIKPPLFVIMTNEPEAVHFSYQRYVANQIRDEFGFVGVPIKVKYKPRRKHRWGESP